MYREAYGDSKRGSFGWGVVPSDAKHTSLLFGSGPTHFYKMHKSLYSTVAACLRPTFFAKFRASDNANPIGLVGLGGCARKRDTHFFPLGAQISTSYFFVRKSSSFPRTATKLVTYPSCLPSAFYTIHEGIRLTFWERNLHIFLFFVLSAGSVGQGGALSPERAAATNAFHIAFEVRSCFSFTLYTKWA